jgi:DnaK suppressor protein
MGIKRTSKKVVVRSTSTPRRSAKPAEPVPRKISSSPRSKYGTIKRDLEGQRRALLAEASEVIANRQDTEMLPDLSDQATAEAEKNFVIRLKEREIRLVKKIDEALDRIAARTYGLCQRCGEEIPFKRLKARPVTTLCIDCKTLEEQEERLRR